MREIKFRSWETDHHKMIDWDSLREAMFLHGIDIFNEDLFDIMQFTGLHDKNGKEIYEGDIVQTNEGGWIAKVIFEGGMFMCTGLDDRGWSYFCDWNNFEVIGNIYENPELMA